MRVDQLVPAFHIGDAIGDEASQLKKFFLTCGFDSEIYCLTRDSGLEAESRLFESFLPPSPSDVAILHFALPSPLTRAFIQLPCKKILIYHNITPASFFEGFSPELARIFRRGREELESLVPGVSLALADSEFNRQELLNLGIPKAEVFPLFIEFKKYQKPEDRFLFNLFRDERINILYVSRIAPNKKIEDLIKVVFYYKKYISPLVRLVVAGKTNSIPKYFESLVRLADEFYLQPEEICFTGHVSEEEMYALYRASDVFLSLSEHEGFGLPLVESMVFDLPVIAYDSTAVPHTLGGAGILIRHKRVEYVAELVHVVATDKKLRAKIIQGQRRRVKELMSFNREEFLLERIKEINQEAQR